MAGIKNRKPDVACLHIKAMSTLHSSIQTLNQLTTHICEVTSLIDTRTIHLEPPRKPYRPTQRI
jgi:hypothetical protein